MKPMIGIRADANQNIAMGHVMRCLSVALQLKNDGWEVLFILSDACARPLIVDAGFACEVLDNDYAGKEAELPQLLRLCQAFELKGMLVDSYQVTPGYLTQLRRTASVAYIDDLNAFPYDVDILINYSAGACLEEYAGQGYKNTRFLLGSSYTPLRSEFSQGVQKIIPETFSIFITTGGTDSYDMIPRLLTHIENSSLAGHDKHIVLGKFYDAEDALRRRQETDASLHIYRDIPHIRKIMMQCDMAVSAGGSTLCELAACGIPTVAFTMADNQLNGTLRFADTDCLIYAGDVRENEEATAENIVSALASLSNNLEQRRRLAANSHAMVDGSGAARIAGALAACFSL